MTPKPKRSPSAVNLLTLCCRWPPATKFDFVITNEKRSLNIQRGPFAPYLNQGIVAPGFVTIEARCARVGANM
ncbi:hypothetical protein NBRC116601_28520 [Cognatishimia sp. WU-CL00825]